MDCSTWFLVEKQPKMTYPLPPRFLLQQVLRLSLVKLSSRGLVRRFAVLHVEVASEWMY